MRINEFRFLKFLEKKGQLLMIEEESVIDGCRVGERNMTTGARSETKTAQTCQFCPSHYALAGNS